MSQKHYLPLQQKITMTEKDKYYKDIAKAVKFFWNTKKTQLKASSDKSNRGAVVGGKQMDAFVGLIKQVAIDAGVPDSCIYTKNNYLPGFFRSSKDWDLLIISPSKKLIAAIELKSQIGSYGNNFNNRTEEVLGSAVDLWTAFRENQFPNQQAPWVGYFIVVGKDKKSTTPVKNNESHYSVRQEFKNASYIDRYRILCQKLILERHYTSVALLCTSDAKTFEDVADDVSIHSFLNSFFSYLKGLEDEFK